MIHHHSSFIEVLKSQLIFTSCKDIPILFLHQSPPIPATNILSLTPDFATNNVVSPAGILLTVTEAFEAAEHRYGRELLIYLYKYIQMQIPKYLFY